MKINKKECPIVHFYHVGKVRRAFLLDKFQEALRSGTDEYTNVDFYLVELLPESECDPIQNVNPTLVIKPRDVTQIEDSYEVQRNRKFLSDEKNTIFIDVDDFIPFGVWVGLLYDKVGSNSYVLKDERTGEPQTVNELYKQYRGDNSVEHNKKVAELCSKLPLINSPQIGIKGDGLDFLVWVNKYFTKTPNEFLYYRNKDKKKKGLTLEELYRLFKEPVTNS